MFKIISKRKYLNLEESARQEKVEAIYAKASYNTLLLESSENLVKKAQYIVLFLDGELKEGIAYKNMREHLKAAIDTTIQNSDHNLGVQTLDEAGGRLCEALSKLGDILIQDLSSGKSDPLDDNDIHKLHSFSIIYEDIIETCYGAVRSMQSLNEYLIENHLRIRCR